MKPIEAHAIAPQAALIQLATGTLATGLAVAFACPALGAAGIGTLADGERYAQRAPLWRLACIMVAALALGATIYAIARPLPVSGWMLIAFGALGLLAHAAATFAALPARLTWLRGGTLAASVHGVMLASGALLVLRPAGWICLAATALIGLAVLGSRVRGRERNIAAS